MQLISKIEVHYLRSLYGAKLDRVGDLNVVFGRNDSGKSNLLRALNLFFNGETETSRPLDFDLDMSDQRRQEARDTKGRQFIWIKVTFNVPENYQAALGKEISVKKQWNRDGGMTQTVSPLIEGAGKQARLTRFLNDIDFNYIPAIKDLDVYADLIERMYGAAAETPAMQQATDAFVGAIGGQTEALSRELSRLFNSEARLAPPTEMSRLFRNLDFAHGENAHSLLRQKGDGVKARHLPELLRFINESESRTRFYLWGFEEPENSLDLGAAEEEARRFATFSQRADTQIFVTTHSPAFYLSRHAEGAEVRRFFITKQTLADDGKMAPKNASARIDKLEEAESKMEHAGLMQLPYVIRSLTKQRDLLDKKGEEAAALKARLADLERPTLFVEGQHDVELFGSALRAMGHDDQISIRSLGGTPNTSDALFKSVLEQGGINADVPALFLFDNDRAGRQAHSKLVSKQPGAEPVTYREPISAWALPQTEDFRRFVRRHNIAPQKASFTAEFLYPVAAAAALCLELLEAHPSDDADRWRTTINGDYWHSLGQQACGRLLTADAGSADWFFARGVPDYLKREYAEEALRRGLDAASITGVAETIAANLLP